MSLNGLSRAIQGIVTGIGFVGTGTILKLNEQVIGTLVTVLVLVLEHFIDSRRNTQKKN